ncbi:unnamed protein product, partial [Closterium sp. NIES-64]
ASKWSQHAFAGSPSFTRFSGYRMGARKLAAVGFGRTDLQHTRAVANCSWQASDAVLPCTAAITYSLSANPGHNQEMLVTASFDAPVPNTGGHLTVAIDHQPFVLYRERPSEHEALDPPTTDLPVEVLVCALPPDPAHPVPLHSLHEFLEFYRLSGAARVVLYDNGAWQEGGMAEQVAGQVERGEVVVVPFHGSRDHQLHRQGKVSAARQGKVRAAPPGQCESCTARASVPPPLPAVCNRAWQGLAAQDCAWGAGYTAHWVVPAELNEFLFTGSQPAALPTFLRTHGAAAVVTVGSLWWSSAKCSLDFGAGEQGGGKFWVERMVYRWPWPVCHDTSAFPDANLCLGETGYRKPIVDPRKHMPAHIEWRPSIAHHHPRAPPLGTPLVHHHWAHPSCTTTGHTPRAPPLGTPLVHHHWAHPSCTTTGHTPRAPPLGTPLVHHHWAHPSCTTTGHTPRAPPLGTPLVHHHWAHPSPAKRTPHHLMSVPIPVRQVEALGAFEARAGGGEGGEVDVRTEDAVYNHVQDLFSAPSSSWCHELFNDDQGPEWWVRDTFLRDHAQSLRAGRVCDFDKGQCELLSQQ